MTTVHESADYTFQRICETGWYDEANGDAASPTGYFYKLTITNGELPYFLEEFGDATGFDSDLLPRVLKDGHHFVVLLDSYGNWTVEQFPTFAERDQLWQHMSRQYDEWINE